MIDCIFTGDIMPGAQRITEPLSSDVQKDFQKSDIVVGNLESPIVTRPPARMNLKKIPLWSHAGNVEILKQLGFTHLSLNNNHTMDLFENGLDETLMQLDNANIKGFGLYYNNISQYYRVEKNGIRLGMLAVNWVQPHFSEGLIHDLKELNIEGLKETTDFLILLIHWGDEHNIFVNRDQQDTARQLIDMGVDLVIGHHPHVPQGFEIYKGKYIFYSLGNFLFTPREEYEWLPYDVRYEDHRENILFQRLECKIGLYVRIVFSKESYVVNEMKPIYRENTMPVPLPGHLMPFFQNLLVKMNAQIASSAYKQNDTEKKRILASYTLPLIFTHPFYWPIFFKKLAFRKVLWFTKRRPS